MAIYRIIETQKENKASKKETVGKRSVGSIWWNE